MFSWESLGSEPVSPLFHPISRNSGTKWGPRLCGSDKFPHFTGA